MPSRFNIAKCASHSTNRQLVEETVDWILDERNRMHWNVSDEDAERARHIQREVFTPEVKAYYNELRRKAIAEGRTTL